VHVAPQLIPAGLDAIEPEPAPEVDVVSMNVGSPKVAVTERASSIVTVHVPVPVHAPDHPAKVLLPVGVAVSVTDGAGLALKGYDFVHVRPQEMPLGDDVTVPVPVPSFVTVSTGSIGDVITEPLPMAANVPGPAATAQFCRVEGVVARVHVTPSGLVIARLVPLVPTAAKRPLPYVTPRHS
jgi:hypothetical protein